MEGMTITGIVKKGFGRGAGLGFPTANIHIAERKLVDGIYLAWTAWEVHKKPSLVFIGSPETFDDTVRRMEVYVLDLDRDLYEKAIEVELIKKIRENIKFDSAEDLIAQMKRDEILARQFFGLL